MEEMCSICAPVCKSILTKWHRHCSECGFVMYPSSTSMTVSCPNESCSRYELVEAIA